MEKKGDGNGEERSWAGKGRLIEMNKGKRRSEKKKI